MIDRLTCSEADCNADATHWGLCEAHAREDDPEAFDDTYGMSTDPEAAS